MTGLRTPLAGILLGLALAIAAAIPAGAHFLLNLNVRIFHVEHLSNGLKLYLRTPMPYLVADRVGPADPEGLPAPAPFTSNRLEDDKPAHYIDPEQLLANPVRSRRTGR